MKLAFRTDASTAIGTGHVSRCLALAAAARDAGGGALFICRAHDGHLINAIEAAGFPVHALPITGGTGNGLAHGAWLGATQEEDAAATIAALAGSTPDWLVVDHYGLDARWERLLAPHARHVMAIDDLADRPHAAGLLLDQNFFAEGAARYDGLLAPDCRALLGPRYALLRPAFAAARQTLPPRRDAVGRILIYFGGVDAGGHSAMALDALDRLGRDDLDVDLVIGALQTGRAALMARAQARPRTTVHAGGADMAALMAAAGLAIGAGGVTQWERACLGLPSIVLGIAANQRPIVAGLAAAGYCWGLSDGASATASGLAALIHSALISHDARLAMAARLAALCDGHGVRRVLAAMRGADMALRPLCAADGAAIFHWRNDPATRRHALNPAPLSLDGHLAWLASALADDGRLLWMGVLDGRDIGVLRFDLEGDTALVSIYLDPARHGQGLGEALLRAGLRRLASERPGIRHIDADVLDANQASRAIFEGAGFAPHQRRYRFSLMRQETQT